MARRSAALASMLLATLAACSSDQATPVSPDGAARLSVTAAPASSASGRYLVNFATDAIPADFGARVAALGGKVNAAYDGVGVAVVSGLSTTAAQQLVGSDVTDVGPDQTFQFLDPNEATTAADASSAAIASPTNPAGAFFYARQWDMRQIGADRAWAAGQLGSSSVRVAILDTGIDYMHADLAGHVDLANSASFVPEDDALVAAYFPTRNPVTDLHYHGTHVAATVSSNGIAAAGVTSKTTLMAVKVLDVYGSGSTSAILAGIVFAANHGANVINMSLGNSGLFSTRDKETKDFFKKTVDRAFNYAHSKGVTVVVAAGNESQDLDVKKTYKPFCSSPHVICVSATGPTAGSTNGPWANIDAFASYSNFGKGEVSVAAPGGNNGGFVYAACSTSSLQIPICQTGTYVVGLAGTSMATPHVSGLAALLAAKGASSGNIVKTIEKSADDLGARGNDALYGNGRINVANALGL